MAALFFLKKLQKSVDFRVRMRYYSYQLCECSNMNLWRESILSAVLLVFAENLIKNLEKSVDKKIPMI